MLSLFMSAIEVTIVATALPQIVGKLGGFTLYSWVFAGFLLAQTSTTVIFGKLSDIYGRKPVIIAVTCAFLAASLLCGFAWSMGSLIAFRLLQGLGAGAMQPIAVTIAGDIYTPQERLKIQAWLSAVWAGAAILGPLAGGLIVEKLSWSWIFWGNIPFGLLTIAGYVFFLHEDVARKTSTASRLPRRHPLRACRGELHGGADHERDPVRHRNRGAFRACRHRSRAVLSWSNAAHPNR